MAAYLRRARFRRLTTARTLGDIATRLRKPAARAATDEHTRYHHLLFATPAFTVRTRPTQGICTLWQRGGLDTTSVTYAFWFAPRSRIQPLFAFLCRSIRFGRVSSLCCGIRYTSFLRYKRAGAAFFISGATPCPALSVSTTDRLRWRSTLRFATYLLQRHSTVLPPLPTTSDKPYPPPARRAAFPTRRDARVRRFIDAFNSDAMSANSC